MYGCGQRAARRAEARLRQQKGKPHLSGARGSFVFPTRANFMQQYTVSVVLTGRRWITIRWHLGAVRSGRQGVFLLARYFFHFPDLLLNFAGDLFILTVGFEMRIVNGVPNRIFYCTFYFVRVAFCPIFCAVFHGFSP